MKVFNTLADLQAAPLKADSKQLVQTKGKLSIGDGLGETYYITTGTPDNETSFGLVNGNIAVISKGFEGYPFDLVGSSESVRTNLTPFNSVAELTGNNAKANSLQVGQRVGRYYYEKGDAGYAEGIIKTSAQATADGDIIDGYYNVLLANGNVWVGSKQQEVNAYTWGLNPDGVGAGVLDTTSVLNAISTSGAKRLRIPPNGNPYMIDVSRSWNLQSGVELLMHGATIKALPNSFNGYKVINVFEKENITIRGGVVKGDRYEHIGTIGEGGMCLDIRASNNITVYDTIFEDGWGDGIYIGSDNDANRTPCKDIKLFNVTCRNNRRNNLSVINVINLDIGFSKFIGANGIAPKAGVDLEPNNIAEQITNVKLFGCEFTDNVGAGLMTAGPISISKDLYVYDCTFKDNFYGLSSTIRNTQVFNSYSDGATTTANAVGGFTIADGKVCGCTAKNFIRTGFGATGSGDVSFENCETLFNNTGAEDTFLYIAKNGGELSVKNCKGRGRANSIRSESSTVDRLEVVGNTFWRFFDGAFGSTYPLRIDSLLVTGKANIVNNTFEIPQGSTTDGIIIMCNPDSNYLIWNNDVRDWIRNNTNWYYKAAGTGSINLSAGNLLPSGLFE